MQGKVLIVGASGLVGTQACQSFIDAGWSVIAASRRYPDLVHGEFEHLHLDIMSQAACEGALQQHPDITHLVYTAVFELPGLMPGWSDPLQIKTNDAMLRNVLAPLIAHGNLAHVSLLQGTKAYGASVRPMRVPARESQPRVEHPNFYWLQEDFLLQAASRHGFSHTILRPQLIVGPNHGVVMNLPPVIGAYAALRRAEGKPFSFPGGADWVWEAVDARLVGNACLWAASSPAARSQTYNLTNGEVFLWRDMWPALADTLGVTVGDDEPVDIAEYMQRHEETWQQIVARHDLAPIPLKSLVGESHHYANLCFGYGADQPPPPTFVSTVKIKQHGFTETMNSEESFCFWLEDLRRRRVIP